MNFSDLRAILQYVPQFRGKTFVVALDGSVVDSQDFTNILLDLAVLRSLSIRIVLVHGAAAQIEKLGSMRGIPLSNLDGNGLTDAETLEVSMDAISRLGNEILQSLTTAKVRAACANAVHAYPAGIIGGEDQIFTGTVDRVDAELIQGFLEQDILPVVQPLGFDADGQILRLNSDRIAREVALALGAEKILFLSEADVSVGTTQADRQLSADAAQQFLEEAADQIPSGVASKLSEGIRATRDGIPRVHLISSRQDDALLSELFSTEGVGLMVYADAYLRIRPAERSDIDELHTLIHRAVEDEQLVARSRATLQDQLDDFILLEIDNTLIGCVALHSYQDSSACELACLFIKRGHNGQGYGQLLFRELLNKAHAQGASGVFALSTQAVGYLERLGFVKQDDLNGIPERRVGEWLENARNAVALWLPDAQFRAI